MAKTRSKKNDKQDIRQQLIDAITAGDVDLVRDLIAQGAYSADDRDIDLALEKTNKRKHKAITALLKNACTDLADQFLEAAKVGKTKAVRDLIARGADLRSTNKKGATAWELAATAGHDAVVKVLKGAVSEPGDLLADRDSGHTQRAACPICGEFYDVDDVIGEWGWPECGHLLSTRWDDSGIDEAEDNEAEDHNDVNMFDDIVFDVADDIGHYIWMEEKRYQKGLGKYSQTPSQPFEKEFLKGVPKTLAPAIESMMKWGKEWWTCSSGVKEGVNVEIIEFLSSSHHRSFFHQNPKLCARKHKDTASKVSKWLEKQIGGPHIKLLMVTYPAKGKKGGECFEYFVTEREARQWLTNPLPIALDLHFYDFIEVAVPVTAQGLAEYLNTQPYL